MDALPELSLLSHEQKDALIRVLFEKVRELTARVEELEARLSKDKKSK
jgi:BMFP domain-containing protein YqiC